MRLNCDEVAISALKKLNIDSARLRPLGGGLLLAYATKAEGVLSYLFCDAAAGVMVHKQSARNDFYKQIFGVGRGLRNIRQKRTFKHSF